MWFIFSSKPFLSIEELLCNFTVHFEKKNNPIIKYSLVEVNQAITSFIGLIYNPSYGYFFSIHPLCFENLRFWFPMKINPKIR